MRRFMPGDLDALAAAVEAVGADQRGAVQAHHLIARAQMADRYVRRFGRAHPRLGDGSVMSAAMKETAGKRGVRLDTVAGLRAMAIAATALAAWKADAGRVSPTRRTRSA